MRTRDRVSDEFGRGAEINRIEIKQICLEAGLISVGSTGSGPVKRRSDTPM
jgi:hypothetical protein